MQLFCFSFVQCNMEVVAILIGILPVLGICLGSSIILIFMILHYRFKRELLKAGKFEPYSFHEFKKILLLIGLLAIATGTPLSLLMLIIKGVSFAVLGGAIPFCTGIALVIFYFVSRK